MSWLSPLWHAVELCRAATTGVVAVGRGGGRCTSRSWSACLAVGCWWGVRRFDAGADAVIGDRLPRSRRPGRRRQCRVASGAARGGSSSATLLAYRRMWLAFLTGLFEPLLYLLSIGHRRRWPGRQGAGPGRAADPVRPVRRAGVDGGGGDERRGARHHVQLLLQVQVRAHLRRDARDAARGAATSPSASSTWALLRGGIYSAAFLLTMVLLGLVGSWWAVLAMPAAAAHRVRVRGCGDRGDDVHAVVDRLRLREPRAHPDVPVRGDVLPALAVPRRGCSGSCACTPLYQGVALERGLTTGQLEWTMLLNVALPRRHGRRRPPHRHPPPRPPPPALTPRQRTGVEVRQ